MLGCHDYTKDAFIKNDTQLSQRLNKELTHSSYTIEDTVFNSINTYLFSGEDNRILTIKDSFICKREEVYCTFSSRFVSGYVTHYACPCCTHSRFHTRSS